MFIKTPTRGRKQKSQGLIHHTHMLDVLYGLSLIGHLPAVMFNPRRRDQLWRRLTAQEWRSLEPASIKSAIWVHAVSVGEAAVAASFIQASLPKVAPHRIVLSCTTDTGLIMARQRLKEWSVPVFQAPLDFSWCVQRAVQHIKPCVYVSVETEIWPNLFKTLANEGVPIVLINARLSDRSFFWYQRSLWFWRNVFKRIHRVAAQSKKDAQRFIDLGVEPERIRVTGNLKFAGVGETQGVSSLPRPWSKRQHVLIGASTHPGEEEILIEVYQRILNRHPEARLMLAPRHVERADAVARWLRTKGWRPLFWSRMNEAPSSWTQDAKTVLLVDRIGVLFQLYAWADAVFIGKTLTRFGGQNPIEPAVWGKPIVMGPRFDNFKEVVSLFQQDDAMAIVRNESALYEQWDRWVSHPDEAVRMGQRAKRVVARQRKSLDETLEWIAPVLKR